MCPCQDPFYDNLTGCSAVYCGGSGGGSSGGCKVAAAAVAAVAAAARHGSNRRCLGSRTSALYYARLKRVHCGEN